MSTFHSTEDNHKLTLFRDHTFYTNRAKPYLLNGEHTKVCASALHDRAITNTEIANIYYQAADYESAKIYVNAAKDDYTHAILIFNLLGEGKLKASTELLASSCDEDLEKINEAELQTYRAESPTPSTSTCTTTADESPVSVVRGPREYTGNRRETLFGSSIEGESMITRSRSNSDPTCTNYKR